MGNQRLASTMSKSLKVMIYTHDAMQFSTQSAWTGGGMEMALTPRRLQVKTQDTPTDDWIVRRRKFIEKWDPETTN
jgi:hypothetical protein